MTAARRVLLADDHQLVADGIARLLVDAGFELLGHVRDGDALVEAARRLRPDVIVADLTMPRRSGLEALRELRRQGVPSRVVILTVHADARIIAEARRAGAAAWVSKCAAGDDLVAALHAVLRGQRWVGPDTGVDPGDGAALTAPPAAAEHLLTPRQREVLQLVAEGCTMKEIAAALGLSTRTVESHKYQMMRALGLRTTAELIRYALRTGVVVG